MTKPINERMMRLTPLQRLKKALNNTTNDLPGGKMTKAATLGAIGATSTAVGAALWGLPGAAIGGGYSLYRGYRALKDEYDRLRSMGESINESECEFDGDELTGIENLVTMVEHYDPDTFTDEDFAIFEDENFTVDEIAECFEIIHALKTELNEDAADTASAKLFINPDFAADLIPTPKIKKTSSKALKESLDALQKVLGHDKQRYQLRRNYAHHANAAKGSGMLRSLYHKALASVYKDELLRQTARNITANESTELDGHPLVEEYGIETVVNMVEDAEKHYDDLRKVFVEAVKGNGLGVQEAIEPLMKARATAIVEDYKDFIAENLLKEEMNEEQVDEAQVIEAAERLQQVKDFEQLDEISKKVLGSYINGVVDDMKWRNKEHHQRDGEYSSAINYLTKAIADPVGLDKETVNTVNRTRGDLMHRQDKFNKKNDLKNRNRRYGVKQAVKKMSESESNSDDSEGHPAQLDESHVKHSSLKPGDKVVAGYRSHSWPAEFVGYHRPENRTAMFSNDVRPADFHTLKDVYKHYGVNNLKDLENHPHAPYATFKSGDGDVYHSYLYNGRWSVGTSADPHVLKKPESVTEEWDYEPAKRGLARMREQDKARNSHPFEMPSVAPVKGKKRVKPTGRIDKMSQLGGPLRMAEDTEQMNETSLDKLARYYKAASQNLQKHSMVSNRASLTSRELEKAAEPLYKRAEEHPHLKHLKDIADQMMDDGMYASLHPDVQKSEHAIQKRKRGLRASFDQMTKKVPSDVLGYGYAGRNPWKMR